MELVPEKEYPVPLACLPVQLVGFLSGLVQEVWPAIEADIPFC
jgi:hypothetical protein